MNLVHAWLKIPFWQRVAGAFLLGALAGWLLGPAAQTWFGPLGTMYVNLIKMIAIPLVFFAVVSAVGSLAGQRSIAALAVRTFAEVSGQVLPHEEVWIKNGDHVLFIMVTDTERYPLDEVLENLRPLE